MIAFYYALTGFACVIYYRRELTKSVKNFFFIGVGPLVGGLILAGLFVKAILEYRKVDDSYSGTSLFGIGLPVVIGVGLLLIGVVLLVVWRARRPRGVLRAQARDRRSGRRGRVARWASPRCRRRRSDAGTIVLGYDASPGARGALTEAVALAKEFGDQPRDRVRRRAVGERRRGVEAERRGAGGPGARCSAATR